MKSALPKVLHTVSGQPMLGHVLALAESLPNVRIVVVAGHGIEQVRAFVGRRAAVVEQKERRGSGHALMQAKKQWKNAEAVLVLCGDMPLLRSQTVRALVSEFGKSKADGMVLTAEAAAPKGYGRIVRDLSGNVARIVEEASASPEEKNIRQINTGAYVFKKDCLSDALATLEPDPIKKEFYLTDTVEKIAARGTFGAMQLEDAAEAFGINSRRHLADAEAAMNRRILEKWMDSGVTIRDPRTTWIGHGVTIGADTEILPHTVIEGPTRIGKKCVIGPFARIRPGVTLGDEVTIGNFVEVVRSTIGNKTLVKHLSYLGDARVGRGVNIGCGTITANFDGKLKHVTQIADGAQTGSGTVLVAPVKIGKNSRTGAGAVVTRGQNVPAGATAVGVPAKLVKKGKK